MKNSAGEVVELRCTYDPATRGGNAPDGRKVRATLHWVDAASAVPAEIRLYNPLFTRPDPGAAGEFFADLNPNSLEVLTGSRVEPALAGALPAEPMQFERQGYFCLDPNSSRAVRSSTAQLACAIAGPRRKRVADRDVNHSTKWPSP